MPSDADDTAAAPSSPASSPPAKKQPSETGGGYRILHCRIQGISPLLMHSSRLVDPLNPIVKEIKRTSKKRPKTDADLEEIARLEFLGGLWISGGEPCLLAAAVETALVQAARKSKRGQQARAGLMVPNNTPLIYDGPRAPAALWADERFRLIVPARVGNSRVMRARPIFRQWAADIELHFIDDQLDESDVIELLATAGRIIGIGDWRPKFGRFEIES